MGSSDDNVVPQPTRTTEFYHRPGQTPERLETRKWRTQPTEGSRARAAETKPGLMSSIPATKKQPRGTQHSQLQQQHRQQQHRQRQRLQLEAKRLRAWPRRRGARRLRVSRLRSPAGQHAVWAAPSAASRSPPRSPNPRLVVRRRGGGRVLLRAPLRLLQPRRVLLVLAQLVGVALVLARPRHEQRVPAARVQRDQQPRAEVAPLQLRSGGSAHACLPGRDGAAGGGRTGTRAATISASDASAFTWPWPWPPWSPPMATRREATRAQEAGEVGTTIRTSGTTRTCNRPQNFESLPPFGCC